MTWAKSWIGGPLIMKEVNSMSPTMKIGKLVYAALLLFGPAMVRSGAEAEDIVLKCPNASFCPLIAVVRVQTLAGR
jgi:hypothetical protein